MHWSRSSRRRGWGAAGVATLLVVAAAVAAMSAFAAVGPSTLRVGRVHLTGASGSRTESIVVNGRGASVYWLGGESSHHLICKSSACWRFWPPVKVSGRARPKAVGFSGRLGTVHRGGFTQVTLNGHPVYTFLEDGGRRGIATGDGQVAFGGTWHVFPNRAASAPTAPGPSSSTTTTSMSTTTTTPYPGY